MSDELDERVPPEGEDATEYPDMEKQPTQDAEPDHVPTVSLLDLMQDSAPAHTETAVPPSPLITSPDEETGTLTSPPESQPERPIGLPLTPDDLTPPETRPLENDEEATAVQPRVAFPGSTKQRIRPILQPPPASEAPTQIHQQPASQRPSPPPRQPKRDPHYLGGQQPQLPTQKRPSLTQPQQPKREPQPTRVAMPPKQQPVPKPQTRRQRNWGSCLTRTLIILLILGVAGVALSIAGAAIGYNLIAKDLPSPQQLRESASAFETARIYDRNGDLLYA
ncbi:MAG: hypothetical protein KC415_14660, partial [Anaerolineales bacterium]|nr:hypothetical protein [Anaerolineales bacterium]